MVSELLFLRNHLVAPAVNPIKLYGLSKWDKPPVHFPITYDSQSMTITKTSCPKLLKYFCLLDNIIWMLHGHPKPHLLQLCLFINDTTLDPIVTRET